MDTTISSVYRASQLTFLNLGFCIHLTDAALFNLASLPGLEHLVLEGCSRITKVEPLAALPSLRVLDLRQCEICSRSIGCLKDFSRLDTLILAFSAALHGSPSLGNLTRLTCLDIQGAGPGMQPGAWAGLQTLSKLVTLRAAQWATQVGVRSGSTPHINAALCMSQHMICFDPTHCSILQHAQLYAGFLQHSRVWTCQDALMWRIPT